MFKDNSLKILAVTGFILLSAYYLYPTLRNWQLQGNLDGLDDEARRAYVDEHYGTIQWANENALKLGLDLQGGMLVTLEVGVDRLVRDLATDRDDAFNAAVTEAQRRANTDGTDFMEAFGDVFQERDADARLSRYFRNTERDITRRSTNDEILAYLSEEAGGAVDRAVEIIRDRVDRFGVSEPSIQKQGTRRIVVELPGVDDPDRVRKLLRGTAKLEFRLMIEPTEMAGSMQRALAFYDQQSRADTTAAVADSAAVAVADSAAADSTFDVTELIDDAEADEADANPLLQVFRPYPYQDVILGSAYAADTARVRELLFGEDTRTLWPADVQLMWTANPVAVTEEGREEFFALGVRRGVDLTGESIVEATADFDQLDNQPKVSMTMNSEGARIWSRLTGANVNKKIAIVMDNVVYSYPNVIQKITGGRSEISGLESLEEAKDIVTILKSGALPAPVDIVAEQTVGPSLGAASIRAGTLSTMLGLLMVAVFMIFYYRSGGSVADIALFLNILFIFGILAGFKATLTLPGIAGIVLTIGMAVDANVLIFERIREEQATGKTLKAAIAGGYASALSAILDANITTFLVAAILYSFGSGPIQGFAVTLMAGILSSLFTAIIVTRLVVEWMLRRRMNMSFG